MSLFRYPGTTVTTRPGTSGGQGSDGIGAAGAQAVDVDRGVALPATGAAGAFGELRHDAHARRVVQGEGSGRRRARDHLDAARDRKLGEVDRRQEAGIVLADEHLRRSLEA